MWTAFVLCSGGVNAEVYDNVLASIVNYSTGRKELESLHNLLSVRVLFRRSSLASQIGGVWESPAFLGGAEGPFWVPDLCLSHSSDTKRILLETYMSNLSMLMMLKNYFFFQWILTIAELVNPNGSISQMLTCCQCCCCYCHCCHFKNVVFHASALKRATSSVCLWGKRSGIYVKKRDIYPCSSNWDNIEQYLP